MSSLQTLFVDEVKDIYNGEKQILRALPKMVKAAGPPSYSRKVILGVGTNGWYKSQNGETLSAGTLMALIRFYPSSTGGFFSWVAWASGRSTQKLPAYGPSSPRSSPRSWISGLSRVGDCCSVPRTSLIGKSR